MVQTQIKKHAAISASICAVLLFVVVNLAAQLTHFGKRAPSDFPEESWTSWAVRDYLGRKPPPNLVFMGSSLVLVPIAGCDADLLQRRLDGSKHHTSLYFQNAFQKITGKPISAFNFALPGEMPSDAYLITKFILAGKKRPSVIVYGLGPRDFMDNLLPSPASTDPYRYLSRFGSVEKRWPLYMVDWQEKLNYALSNIFYLYGNKNDLQAESDRKLASDLNKFVPAPKGAKDFSIFDRRLLFPDYRPTELNAGEAFFRPVKKDEKIAFADNLGEYKKRYRTVKWDTFLTQMLSFADMLDCARSRGIHVVVVSMPITDINRSLIADYAWDLYRQNVHALARMKGASYIDLQGSKKFELADFMDTVHLHSRGGQKMLDILVDKLSQDQVSRQALGLAKEPVQIARQSKVDSAL